ncbi:MAG TPA: hypothetical protein VFQ85_07455 [Mycobacteriales bacterium]|jgi:hypothetical protein|nr:hypothetical protein [Mycobacteriales bacterium]
MPAHLLDSQPMHVSPPVDLVWFTSAAAALGLPIDVETLAHGAATRYTQLLHCAANDWTPVHDDTGVLVGWLDDDGTQPVTASELRVRAVDEAADRLGVVIDHSPHANVLA